MKEEKKMNSKTDPIINILFQELFDLLSPLFLIIRFDIQQMNHQEIPWMEVDMIDNGRMVIGNVFCSENRLLLENAVENETFFRYTHDVLLENFMEVSTVRPNWHRNEIVKLQWEPIPGLGSHFFYYNTILKTHFLRLVQRRWKSVLKERQAVLQGKEMLRYLCDRPRLGGRARPPVIPGLRGMLATTLRRDK
jgi:hypothetical protein